MSNLKFPVLLAVVLPLLAAPASAHHSFAAYDTSKTITVQATIKEFDWGAPHSSGSFMIMEPDGQAKTVSVVAGAPISFSSQGFHAHDFKKGLKVTLSYHPLRTGDTSGGSLVGLVFPDGRKYGDTAPGNTAAPPK
jgi:hypothetical protein